MALRRRLAVLACACAGLAVAAPAPATAAGWADGSLAYTYTINCGSIIFGNPYFEAMSGHYASFWVSDPLQGVGEIFYLRTVIAGMGRPCAGPAVVPEFALHAHMRLAVSPQYPVFCFFVRSGQSQWQQATGGDCPQNPSQGRFGGNSYRFIPQGGAYPLPPGGYWQIQIPVYVVKWFHGLGGPGDGNNCGGCFYAPSQVLDGGDDPTGFAQQWVTTDRTYPGVAFPENPGNPMTTGSNSASLRAFLYNYHAPSRPPYHATIAICEAAYFVASGKQCNNPANGNQWTESDPAVVSGQSYAVQLDAAFTGLKKSTAYKIMVRFDWTEPDNGQPYSGDSHVVDWTSGSSGSDTPGQPDGGSTGTGTAPADAEQPPTQPAPPDDDSTSITGDQIAAGAQPNRPVPVTPGPTPNVPEKLVTVTARSSIRRAALIKAGLKVLAACKRACGLKFELFIPRALAKKLGLAAAKRVLIGRATKRLTKAGRTTVTVKLSKKARRRLLRARKFTMTLRSTATESGAKPLVAEKRISVK